MVTRLFAPLSQHMSGVVTLIGNSYLLFPIHETISITLLSTSVCPFSTVLPGQPVRVEQGGQRAVCGVTCVRGLQLLQHKH